MLETMDAKRYLIFFSPFFHKKIYSKVINQLFIYQSRFQVYFHSWSHFFVHLCTIALPDALMKMSVYSKI